MNVPIVIADDAPTILTLLALALGKEGFETVTASDGAQALELIREHRPRLVILDANMPKGDGFEVSRTLRDDPEIEKPYVIMLTAAGRASDRDRAEEAGVDEFMTKPFSPSQLRARVREILAP
jgi:DNA-binding response OmpR family regulator